ncbi:MAG: ABC transporter substrate-binding protein [Burkholderiales bacterium]|jgi:NitT/TauT family transport system substrate-binding protein
MIRQVLQMRFFKFVIALCCVFGLAAGAMAAKPEKKQVTIAVGGKAALYYLPLTLAEQIGYFRDAGLEVEILDFPGGAKALQAMMGGSADVVSGGFDHTIVMQTRGQKLTAFVLQGATPAISLVVAKDKAAMWHGPQDLKGMKIGVTAPGSSTNMFVNALLARGGLTANDVSIIGVGSGQSAVAAIQAGHLDALANIEPAISMLVRDGRAVEVVETISEQGSRALYGAALPSGSLYTKQAFIDDHPGTVQALTDAMVRALQWLSNATDEEIADRVPHRYLLGDRSLYLEALKRQRASYSLDGRIAPPAAKALLDSLAGFYEPVAKYPVRIQETYTNRFVDAALAKQ